MPRKSLILKNNYIECIKNNPACVDGQDDFLISKNEANNKDRSQLVNIINNNDEMKLPEKSNLASDEKYTVKRGCDNTCKRKCSLKFNGEVRQSINLSYWSLDSKGRRLLVQSLLSVSEVQRKTCLNDSRRSNTIKYRFKDVKGEFVEVCKNFFLETLGYDRKNDTIIRCLMPKECIIPKYDKRRRTTKGIDKDVVKAFIETYNPAVSHYRRKHAPNKK